MIHVRAHSARVFAGVLRDFGHSRSTFDRAIKGQAEKLGTSVRCAQGGREKGDKIEGIST
jgi:hypothetical protein